MATGLATEEGTDSVVITTFREERRTEETFSFRGIIRDDGVSDDGVTNKMILKLLEKQPDIPKSCVSALYLYLSNCKYPLLNNIMDQLIKI